MQTLNFVFTWNNYPDTAGEYLIDLVNQGELRWVAWEEEVCPTTGTPHLQGFLGLNQKATSYKLVHKIFWDIGIWCDNMRGSLRSNVDYCSKVDTLFKFGDLPDISSSVKDKGESKQAMIIKDAIREKGNGAQYDPHWWLQKWGDTYIRNLQHIKNVFSIQPIKKGWMKRTIAVFWGKTGKGKTKRANEWFESEEWGGKPYFTKTGLMGRWWDGYQGEEGVIINEFTDKVWTAQELNDMLDGWPTRVPVKGGSVQFHPTHIIITSNYDPKTWYNPTTLSTTGTFIDTEEHQTVYRRLTLIEELT